MVNMSLIILCLLLDKMFPLILSIFVSYVWDLVYRIIMRSQTIPGERHFCIMYYMYIHSMYIHCSHCVTLQVTLFPPCGLPLLCFGILRVIATHYFHAVSYSSRSVCLCSLYVFSCNLLLNSAGNPMVRGVLVRSVYLWSVSISWGSILLILQVGSWQVSPAIVTEAAARLSSVILYRKKFIFSDHQVNIM